jgi:hypothetical protein
VSRPLYSTRFIGGTVAEGTDAAFTVPAGFVAVVRDVVVTNAASSPGQISWGISTTAGFIVAYNFTELGSGASAQWTGRQVANAGEDLFIFAGVEAIIGMSGYLLTS